MEKKKTYKGMEDAKCIDKVAKLDLSKADEMLGTKPKSKTDKFIKNGKYMEDIL